MEGGSFSSGHLLWHVKPSRNAALARCPKPHISTQWGPFSALSLQIGCRTIIYPRLQPSPQPASPIGCRTDCVFSRHIVHPASLMQPHACCRQALWIPWLTHHFTHLLARPRPSPSLPAACHLLDRRAARPHPPRCTAMTMTPGSLFFLASMDTAACGDDDEAGAAAPAVVRSWPTSWRWRRPTLSLSTEHVGAGAPLVPPVTGLLRLCPCLLRLCLPLLPPAPLPPPPSPRPPPPSPPPPSRHGLRGGQRHRTWALELERSGGAAAPGGLDRWRARPRGARAAAACPRNTWRRPAWWPMDGPIGWPIFFRVTWL